MLKRSLLALGLVGLLAVPAVAGTEAPPSCCAKPAEEATGGPGEAEKLECSLTGETIDECCCVEREGKTYCTLAKKNVETCCCDPAEDDAPLSE
jgi:hypothetical protein